MCGPHCRGAGPPIGFPERPSPSVKHTTNNNHLTEISTEAHHSVAKQSPSRPSSVLAKPSFPHHDVQRRESPVLHALRRPSLTLGSLNTSVLLTTALLLLLPAFHTADAGLPLSDHIQHFEPVFYDASHLLHHHTRAKRDASHHLHLQFTAHNRLFKLRLKRDTSLFADDVVFESSSGPVDFDLAKVYSGVLEDDDLAEVSGVVTKEGLFDGHVSTPSELYYLEPASRYLPNAEFHSVMYKASDVLHPTPARCASQQLHLRGRVHNPWASRPSHTEEVGAFEAVPPPVGPALSPHQASSPSSHSSISSSVAGGGALPTPKAVNPRAPLPTSLPAHQPQQHHHRRPLSQSPSKKHIFYKKSPSFVQQFKKGTREEAPGAQPPTTTHSLSLQHNDSAPTTAHLHQSDSHLDFQLVYEPTRGGAPSVLNDPWNYTRRGLGRGAADELPDTASPWPRRGPRRKRSGVDPHKTTCMLYLQADHLFFEKIGSEEACIETMTRHVQRVNNIYRVTDFDLDEDADQIGFMIKRIKVHTKEALKDPTYRFPGNYGVEKFLELFSEEDYDAFCLAYMFTYRDFEGGTLGLAWTGDLKNAGGVCEKNGHYRGSLKSLNTGIVTLLNYGKHVPPAVSHVTLAHEIGHNFGSPHDPESDTRCTPGGEDGNYIMFARATSGDKRNNNKFSPCSLRQINSVLNSKARDSKGCFTEPQKAICGNGVVEVGEECDCGWEEDCDEPCCFPMKNNPKKYQTPCTLRPNKDCSPSQGPCCTHNCQMKLRDKCRDDNGCRDASFCNGRGPECPPSTNKPNKTICNKEFVCYKGECSGSICLAYGLESCQCERQPGDPITKSCELCCRLPGENNPCMSSFEWNHPPYNIPDMYAKAGTPCNNYKGYCDVFKKCREVDPSGPLATLRGLLLSDESLANLQRWIIQHWYAVLFVMLAFMVLLVAIVKVFGKSPQKAKPKNRTIKHKNSGALQYSVASTPGATSNGTTANGTTANGTTANGTTANGTTANGTTANGTTANGTTANGTADVATNHVVHPTVVRTNLPFKRKVNEVRRAATKAKRVAKSQLSRPHKRPSRRPDGAVTSPTDSEKSGPGAVDGASGGESRVKGKLSSRFSIISFKAFRPKSLSPDKHKARSSDKRKSKSSSNDKKSKSKQPSKTHHRSRSPDKKRRSEAQDKSRKSRSPNKRGSLEDERRKSRNRSVSPDKARRSSSPDKQRQKVRSPDKHHKLGEGNWLINKFLADEEKTAKPIMNGSLMGSLNGSLSSVNAVLGGASGSPQLSGVMNGSTRGLLAGDSNRASPMRGFVNEAFISSPRGARTHSSLRVTKSVSPEGLDCDFGNSKYRRSISMEAYNRPPSSPDKRKRSVLDEGLSPDKRRRFSSPEKSPRQHSPTKERRLTCPERTRRPTLIAERRLSSTSPPSSKTNSYSNVPERIREKLSLITASPAGSIASILPPSESADTVSVHSSTHSCQSGQTQPKEWV